MGVRPPYPYRSAGQAVREIRRYGHIQPDPDFVAGQKALEPLGELAVTGERITEGQSEILHEGRCCDCGGQVEGHAGGHNLPR